MSWLALRVRAEQFDPNDPVNAARVPVDQLNRQMWNVRDTVSARFERGEIDEETMKSVIVKRAEAIISRIDVKKVNPSDAVVIADIARDAHRWNDSAALYSSARELAQLQKNEGDRVHHSLRQAESMGHEGQVAEAIALTRKAFNCPTYAKAQILLPVYMEIVPACQDKGHNDELIQLLQDAVAQDQQAEVDSSSKDGQDYLKFRTGHQKRALKLAATLTKGK